MSAGCVARKASCCAATAARRCSTWLAWGCMLRRRATGSAQCARTDAEDHGQDAFAARTWALCPSAATIAPGRLVRGTVLLAGQRPAICLASGLTWNMHAAVQDASKDSKRALMSRQSHTSVHTGCALTKYKELYSVAVWHQCAAYAWRSAVAGPAAAPSLSGSPMPPGMLSKLCSSANVSSYSRLRSTAVQAVESMRSGYAAQPPATMPTCMRQRRARQDLEPPVRAAWARSW